MQQPSVTARAARMAAIYRDARRAAWIGLTINLALGVAKLLAGWAAHSFALLADAVNSLGDVATSLVVIVALRIAERPADEAHPYGHTRAEAIAGSSIALVIIASAGVVAWETVSRLGDPRPLPPLWALLIAGSNVLIKEALYHYKMAVGRRTGSTALVAHAWDHRSDAFCALAVLVGLASVRWGGESLRHADSLAALVVVGAITTAGVALFRKCASELMDEQAGVEVLGQVRRLASAVPQVEAVEQVRVRTSGLEYFADIHVQVAPELTVAAGHQIGHAVKDALLAALPALRDVLVHLEPFALARRAEPSQPSGGCVCGEQAQPPAASSSSSSTSVSSNSP